MSGSLGGDLPSTSGSPQDHIFPARWWWLLLVAGYLLFSGVYSYLAPCGLWMNEIGGEPVWTENDPGAWYVGAAHQLTWGEEPIFVGHPGSTLLPLLLGVQSAVYAIEGPREQSFTRFTAQHLPTVFFLSKLLMTCLHLVSFVALFTLASKLLGDRFAATFAALGYATSLPVLYYLSRISVEPLMVTFFAIAFLATWRYQELAREQRLVEAVCFVVLAAGAAVSGAVTKFSFLGPLPFFLVAYVLAGARGLRAEGSIPWNVRVLAAGVFITAGLITLALYSQIINWSAFFSAWTTIMNTTQPGDGWTISDFIPGTSPTRIFLLSEIGFSTLGAAGWLLFMLYYPAERVRMLWLSAYGAYGLILWGYRVWLHGNFLPFHYFFLSQAFLAIFFGYFVSVAWRRLDMARSGWTAVAVGSAVIVSLHGLAAWVVVESRLHDASIYAANRSTFTLLSQLGSSERLGVEVSSWQAASLHRSLAEMHGMIFPFFLDPRRSILVDAFDSLVVHVDPESIALGSPLVFSPALHTNIGILRLSEGTRR